MSGQSLFGHQQFIELNRRFRKLDREAKAEETALDSYTLSLLWPHEKLNWDELLNEDRAVLLGEPGSGKTWELRERVRLLTGLGKFAFFIRLDQLVERELRALLSVDELSRFSQWKQNTATAYFFLDSVDEAKFHKVSDFHGVLERFRHEIGNDTLGRANIFLSSRISEWKPVSDAYEFRRLFPVPQKKLRGKNGAATCDKDQKSFPLVVQIQPLDKAQVECLARAQGVADIAGFLDAIDRSFAWEFARRPLDVSDLVSFWKGNGRIGSLTELIEFDISSKLRPRVSRDELQLSEAEGREGAEWLAAASLFSRKFSFFVPDDRPAESEALNPHECLPPSWRDDQTRALLTRALFDSAVYGRFRFHHRRVGEYLAAKWIAARMDDGCPQYELENIIAQQVRGKRVIRPALRPIVAWLCLGSKRWNQIVRNAVVELDPEIHLNFGDPAGLDLDYRRSVLASLAKVSVGRRYTWLRSGHDSLARFSDARLANDIRAFILNRSLAVTFRIEMLELVRYGRLGECLDAALDVIESPHEQDEIKQYAAMAVRAIDSKFVREKLNKIVSKLPNVPNRLCALITEILYPNNISPIDLVKLLAKTEAVSEFGVDLPSRLKSHLESSLSPKEAGELLKELFNLAQSEPFTVHGDKLIPISAQFYWIGRIIPTIIEKLFNKIVLSGDEISTAAEALQLLGHIRECHHLFTDAEVSALNNLSLKQPRVRQAYFWRIVAAFRTANNAEPTHPLQLLDYFEVIRRSQQDFAWLIEDISNQKVTKDKALALLFALETWNDAGRTFAGRKQLLEAVKCDPELRAIYKKSVLTRPFLPIRRFWYHKVQFKKWWWLRRRDLIRARWQFICEQFVLLRNLKLIESGKPLQWLDQLRREADEDNSSHFTAGAWTDLEKKRGKRITRAAKRGCIAVWRGYTPQLPHEKPDQNQTAITTCVGLNGLNIEFDENPMAIVGLTEAEAILAARYATNELNGFPAWIDRLALAHPNAVKLVLVECIEAEWKFPANHANTHEVLADLAWRGGLLTVLVGENVLSFLTFAPPQNATILSFALALLIRDPNPPLSKVGELAARYAPSTDESSSKGLWLTVWMQVDGLSAVTYLRSFLKNQPNAADIMLRLCSHLAGGRSEQGILIPSPSYLQPACLLQLIPLVFAHLKASEAHIERFRSLLLEELSKSESPEATDRLRELADEPAMAGVREWILELLDQRLRREADLQPWTPVDLQNFAQHHEVDPKTDSELFAIARKRILDLKHDVENSDNSLRDELQSDAKEIHLRRWLARKLNERANSRYNVPQEPEIDLQQKPDLRFQRPGLPPVSVEVKLANLGWSVGKLMERLDNQLVGQYLRDRNSRYGIYVIGTIGEKQHWKHPESGTLVSFADVVAMLSERALELVLQNQQIGDVIVIGIDFCEPKRG